VPAARNASICGIEALVAAPILDRQGQVIGALYGDRGEDGTVISTASGPITELQAELVQLLASALAAGLAQRKLVELEHDLELGKKLQTGFLPKELPRAEGWEIAAHIRPARDVSGDFYDAFPLPGGLLALVIADVCGKGVGAALYMTLYRSLLRAFAEQAVGYGPVGSAGPEASTAAPAAIDHRATPLPEHIARSAIVLTDRYVAKTHGMEREFCTTFFGVLDTSSGVLTYVNAGHVRPVLLGPSKIKGRLGSCGPALNLEDEATFEVRNVLLEPGDVLFAYTDGVTEAFDPDEEQFTERRLLPILERPAPSAAALIDQVFSGLQVHLAGAEPHDDVTLLAVRRLP
jgi:sigma-B regulation protein RsbU (phosphoserine phosphatase)